MTVPYTMCAEYHTKLLSRISHRLYLRDVISAVERFERSMMKTQGNRGEVERYAGTRSLRSGRNDYAALQASVVRTPKQTMAECAQSNIGLGFERKHIFVATG
jgi:hypothetical protein